METDNVHAVSDPIDQITLDLLMNRHQYKKYVAKNDPVKHTENLQHIQKINKYRDRISDFTHDLLSDPDTMITLDVNQAFDRYVRTLIRYFEMKDLEKKDDDVLFDGVDDEEEEAHRARAAQKDRDELERKMALMDEADKVQRQSRVTKSFWGKETVIRGQGTYGSLRAPKAPKG